MPGARWNKSFLFFKKKKKVLVLSVRGVANSALEEIEFFLLLFSKEQETS
jgi:hypothetical protein